MTFTYDGQGRLVESATRRAGSVFTSHYGPDGQITESVDVGADGTRSTTKHIGDQTEIVVTDPDGKVILDSRELEKTSAQPQFD